MPHTWKCERVSKRHRSATACNLSIYAPFEKRKPGPAYRSLQTALYEMQLWGRDECRAFRSLGVPDIAQFGVWACTEISESRAVNLAFYFCSDVLGLTCCHSSQFADAFLMRLCYLL
jgi:hypothetical protein